MSRTKASGVPRARHRVRGPHDERGASLVEFAMILPVFMILVLGTLTGGLAYSRELAITSGAREAARFAATRPGPVDLTWARAVRDVAMAGSDGELDPADSGQRICVAMMSGATTTFKVEYNAGVETVFASGSPSCFIESAAIGGRRVQVSTRRTSVLEAYVFSWTLDLGSNAVAKYEAS